jgi:hypothetical protein
VELVRRFQVLPALVRMEDRMELIGVLDEHVPQQVARRHFIHLRVHQGEPPVLQPSSFSRRKSGKERAGCRLGIRAG